MKRKSLKTFSALVVSSLILLCSVQSHGQAIGSAPPKDSITTWKWKFLLEPYLMFANMKGTIGLGNLPNSEVDKDASEIFENLKFGAMIYFEAYSPKWALSSDMLYMKLGADIAPNNIINSGKAEAKQLGWEIALLRRILPFLEAGIGLQLNSIKSELRLNINTLSGPQDHSREISETWLDPMIIARVKLPITKKLLLQVRPSIGGFGIGSDLAWQIQANATYRFSQLFQLSLGYRVIDIDYETGDGSDRFLYDMNTYGPVIRFGFNF
ncbi:MAG TPA: hypothetical protein VFZ42_14095 [Chitinophagaceae bacterium]